MRPAPLKLSRSPLFTLLLLIALLVSACRILSIPAAKTPHPGQSEIPAVTQEPPPALVPTPAHIPAPTQEPTVPPQPGDSTAGPRSAGEDLHRAWTWPAGGAALHGRFFVTRTGDFYLVDLEGKLHALSADGAELWQYAAGENARMIGLAPDEKQLYLVDGDSVIHALDSSGSPIWKLASPQKLQNVPSIAPSGDLYLDATDNRYKHTWLRLSPQGETLPFTWPQAFTSPFILSAVAFGPQSELILLAPRGVSVLDAAGAVLHDCSDPGQKRKFFANAGPQVGSAAGQPALFYVDPQDVLVALSLDCRVVWRLPLSEPAPSLDPGGNPEKLSTALAWSPQGMLYVGRANGQVLAIDSKGTLAWSSRPDERLGQITNIRSGEAGKVYALGQLGYFLAVPPGGQDTRVHEFYDPGLPFALQALPGGAAVLQGSALQVFNTDSTRRVDDPPAVPPPAGPDQARQEIVQYLLDDILTYRLGLKSGSYQQMDQPLWEKDPAQAVLIVLAEAASGERSETFGVDGDRPLRAWWYADGELYEATDPQQAISIYEERYVNGPTPQRWNRYNFGVISISPDARQAKAYVDLRCGGLCGSGYSLSLKRSLGGAWWKISEWMLWIS